MYLLSVFKHGFKFKDKMLRSIFDFSIHDQKAYFAETQWIFKFRGTLICMFLFVSAS